MDESDATEPGVPIGDLIVHENPCAEHVITTYPEVVRDTNEIIMSNKDELLNLVMNTEAPIPTINPMQIILNMVKVYYDNKLKTEYMRQELKESKQKHIIAIVERLDPLAQTEAMDKFVNAIVTDETNRLINVSVNDRVNMLGTIALKIMIVVIIFIVFCSVKNVANLGLQITDDSLKIYVEGSDTVKYLYAGGKGQLTYLGNKVSSVLDFMKKMSGTAMKQKHGRMFGSNASPNQECLLLLDLLNDLYVSLETSVIEYTERAKTQSQKNYVSKHYYFSSTGEKIDAAEEFLRALNKWNNLSDNSHLSDGECGNCPKITTEGVNNVGAVVDTEDDMRKVKELSNFSMTYGVIKKTKKTDKITSAQHWDPLVVDDKSYSVRVVEADSMEKNAGADVKKILLDKIYKRYIFLKRTDDKNRWKGWYYLMRFAFDDTTFYEVKALGSQGPVAYVPIIQHAPELTNRHYIGNTRRNAGVLSAENEVYTIFVQLFPHLTTDGVTRDSVLESLFMDVFCADGKPNKEEFNERLENPS